MTLKLCCTIAGIALGAVATVYTAKPDAPLMAYVAAAAGPVGAYLVGLFQQGPGDPRGAPAVKALLLLPLAALLATGCATAGAAGGRPAAPGEILKALDTIADNPLVNLTLADAARTTAWVDAQARAGMDPVKVELARACPRAVQWAAADLKTKIAGLKARLAGDVGQADLAGTPGVIYGLTVLKYGAPLDPNAAIAQLRADVGLRVDALVTGCVHLVPKKQVHDVLLLLGKAGIVSQLGPLGVLP
jgi:hypothetical protein